MSRDLQEDPSRVGRGSREPKAAGETCVGLPASARAKKSEKLYFRTHPEGGFLSSEKLAAEDRYGLSHERTRRLDRAVASR